MGFPVAQFSVHPVFSPRSPTALYHSPGGLPIQQLSKIENTGFSHLGQAYNSRKGSTYTLAAICGCGLSVSGIGQIQGGVP
jgi:hypothetical protein